MSVESCFIPSGQQIVRPSENCHPERNVAIGEANRNAKSRDLLFVGASMTLPADTSQPKLAAGCRWGGTEENRVILFPEGAIKLQGPGRQVLEQCDGQRTFGEIITELQKQFTTADPEKIRGDISQFLEQLQCKRIVDY